MDSHAALSGTLEGPPRAPASHRLPSEILSLIFEVATWLHPPFACTRLLIERQHLTRYQHRLYRNVTLLTLSQLELFRRSVTDARSAPSLAPLVQALCILPGHPFTTTTQEQGPTADRILSQCKATRRLTYSTAQCYEASYGMNAMRDLHSLTIVKPKRYTLEVLAQMEQRRVRECMKGGQLALGSETTATKLLTVSAAALRRLELVFFDGQVIDLLERLPSVTHLVLTMPRTDDLRSQDLPSLRVIPKAPILRLLDTPPHDASQAHVRTPVQRLVIRAAPYVLERIVAELMTPPIADDKLRFRPLQRGGVNLTKEWRVGAELDEERQCAADRRVATDGGSNIAADASDTLAGSVDEVDSGDVPADVADTRFGPPWDDQDDDLLGATPETLHHLKVASRQRRAEEANLAGLAAVNAELSGLYFY